MKSTPTIIDSYKEVMEKINELNGYEQVMKNTENLIHLDEDQPEKEKFTTFTGVLNPKTAKEFAIERVVNEGTVDQQLELLQIMKEDHKTITIEQSKQSSWIGNLLILGSLGFFIYYFIPFISKVRETCYVNNQSKVCEIIKSGDKLIYDFVNPSDIEE